MLKNVFKLLIPLNAEWDSIGCLLGIENHKLKAIQKDEVTVLGCLREMLDEWLKLVSDPASSWRELITAVDAINPSCSS